jgi:hypothetical protein
MKIYKLADGGMGRSIIELLIDKTDGTFNWEVLEHKDGASCADGMDAGLFDLLDNIEVPGFGKLALVADEGKTAEFFHENKSPAITNTAPADTTPEEEQTLLTTPQDDRRLDLGFGV